MDASDEELVAKAIAENDHGAFSTLVQRYQSQVRGWLRQLTGDYARADDLAQDTFVQAWQKLQSFSGRGKFSAWLMKIAYNNFRQDYRKAKRFQRLRDAVGEQSETAGEQFASPSDGELPDLPKMLAVLSEDERRSMVLNFAYGMSHAEVSDVTGLPVGTVKSHIQRGRAKIRDRFALGESSRD